MSNNPSNIVSVYPDPLIISQSSSSNYLESKLNISNLTKDYVIFKIYNNQHLLYSAKPSTSFIPPKETAEIAIKRFKKEGDQSKTGKDKFLLVFYTINKVINDNEEAKEAFKSKIYNENSEQKTMISVLLKEQDFENESTLTYVDSVLEDVGDDYDKGIKAYTDSNEKLRKQSNSINEKIRDLEKTLEMIKSQKKLKSEKDMAMKEDKSRFKSEGGNFSRILIIGLVLLGLLIGANLANGYNRLFKKDKNVVIQINENSKIYNEEIKMNETVKTNETITTNETINTNDTEKDGNAK